MAEEHNGLKYAGPLAGAAALAAGGGYGDVGISRLSETLHPVLDMWGRPEFAILRSERRWIVTPTAAAVALENSIIGVSNPTSGTLITVVEGIAFDHATNPQVRVRAGANQTFDATANPTPRDTRVPGTFPNNRIATVSFAHAEAAEIGSLLWEVRILASTHYIIPIMMVLSPGFWVGLSQVTQNVNIRGTIFGYERPAFPGELGRLG